eukprot:XP_005616883.1 basic proline-rich protein-like [Canis lupus familiaris]
MHTEVFTGEVEPRQSLPRHSPPLPARSPGRPRKSQCGQHTPPSPKQHCSRIGPALAAQALRTRRRAPTRRWKLATEAGLPPAAPRPRTAEPAAAPPPHRVPARSSPGTRWRSEDARDAGSRTAASAAPAPGDAGAASGGGGQRRGRPAAGPGGPRPGTPPARGHAGPSVSRLPRADLPPRPGARAPPPRAPKQVARAAPTPARGEAAHRPSQADRCDPAENPEPPPPRAAAAADELTLRAPALPRLSDAGGRGGGATRSAPGAGRHYPQCLSAQRACAVASRLHRAAGDPRRWLRAALAGPLHSGTRVVSWAFADVGKSSGLTSTRRPHRRYPGTREDTLQPSLNGERPRPASRSGLRGSRTALAASGRGSRRRGPRGGLSPGHPPLRHRKLGPGTPADTAAKDRGDAPLPRPAGDRCRPACGREAGPGCDRRGSPGPRPRPPGTPPPAAARQGRPPRLSHSTVAPGRRLRPAARTKGREPAQGPPALALPPALPTFPPASQPPRPRSPRPTNLIAEVTLNGARRDLTGGRWLGPPRAGRPAEGPPTLPAPRCPLDEREIDGGAPPPAGDGRAPSRGAEGALGAEGRLPAVPQFTRLWRRRRRPCVRAVPASPDSYLRALPKASADLPPSVSPRPSARALGLSRAAAPAGASARSPGARGSPGADRPASARCAHAAGRRGPPPPPPPPPPPSASRSPSPSPSPRGRAHGSRPGRREPQAGEGTLELGPGRGAASRRAPGRRSASPPSWRDPRGPGRGAGRPS